MKHIHSVTCRELAASMTDYLEDALSAEDRVLIEEHLSLCQGCHNYLDQMVATVRAVGALREGRPTPETRERLLALFRRWKAEREGC